MLSLWEAIVLAKYKALTEQMYDPDKLTKQLRNLVWNSRRKRKLTNDNTELSVDDVMSHFQLGEPLSSFLTIHRLPLSLLHGISISYINYYYLTVNITAPPSDPAATANLSEIIKENLASASKRSFSICEIDISLPIITDKPQR